MLTIQFLLTWVLHFGATSAQWTSQVPVETRSLDEIYLAAQKENASLIVAFGADGKTQSSQRKASALT